MKEKTRKRLLAIWLFGLGVFLVCSLTYVFLTGYHRAHLDVPVSSGYFLPGEEYVVSIGCPEGKKERVIKWTGNTIMEVGLTGIKTSVEVEVNGIQQYIEDDEEIIIKGCSTVGRNVSVGYLQLNLDLISRTSSPKIYFYELGIPIDAD